MANRPLMGENDRRIVACLFATLMDPAGRHNEYESGLLEKLFEHLALPEATRGQVRKLTDGKHDPTKYAAEIQDERVRWMVLHDVLVLCLSDGDYDARERQGMRRLAAALSVPWERVQAAEAELGKHIRNVLARCQKSNETARKETTTRGRWWKVGLAALAGGTALVVTGGLAAPAVGGIIGTYFLGMSGASAVSAGLAWLGGGVVASGAAGGSAVVAGLFGGAGATMFGWAVGSRTAGLSEYRYEHVAGGGVKTVLGIPGFLSQSDEVTKSWAALGKSMPHADAYALRWESKNLRTLGTALAGFCGSVAARGVATAVVRRVATSAFSWPVTLLTAGQLINNPWHMAVDRVSKAAQVLAADLAERRHGKRPITLVGFSLGGRMIHLALQELARKKIQNVVENAVLLGAAAPADRESWERSRSVVAHRLVNVYSKTDWVLAYLYRAAQLTTHVAGIGPVACKGVDNIDATSFVSGHMAYPTKLTDVLKVVAID